jgi:hypothetical protein
MVKFNTPTWIAGERGSGRPGVVAIGHTYGKLKKNKGRIEISVAMYKSAFRNDTMP